MKRRETLKIAACLTVFVLQAAAMILFSFGGCAASVHRTANSAEESPAVPSLDGEALPGSDGFVPVQEDAAQSDSALECLYADAAREERLACAARPDAQYAQSSALLLPHYGNALGMCCDLLSSIEREAALIVLVGPNHSGTGDAIQVSGADWYWSTGRMDGDADAARTLAAAAGTLTDAQIAEDWSVQTLIPYLCRYFPGSAAGYSPAFTRCGYAVTARACRSSRAACRTAGTAACRIRGLFALPGSGIGTGE